jgi:hypothetical protein
MSTRFTMAELDALAESAPRITLRDDGMRVAGD